MDGLQIQFTDNGNLVFTADEETRAAIREYADDPQNSDMNDEQIFLEFIEYYLCNGYSLVSPEDIGALWDGLIIADGTLDEETTPEEAEATRVWAYDHYAVRSYLQDLLDTGRMVWTLYPPVKEAK